MTPRQWLTLPEVHREIDDKLKPVFLRLDQQDRSLERIERKQIEDAAKHDAFHRENTDKINDLRQIGENQLAYLRGRDEVLKKLFANATKVLGWVTSPAAAWGALNLVRHCILWAQTGHFYPPPSH